MTWRFSVWPACVGPETHRIIINWRLPGISTLDYEFIFEYLNICNIYNLYIFIIIYVYIYINACVNMYIYNYIYICIYTHIHI